MYSIAKAAYDATQAGRVAVQAPVVRLTPSTLYDALARLVDQRWIEETASDGPRRRTYALTLRGRDAMTREAQRLARLIAAARAKNVFQDS